MPTMPTLRVTIFNTRTGESESVDEARFYTAAAREEYLSERRDFLAGHGFVVDDTAAGFDAKMPRNMGKRLCSRFERVD
jgi:hypothetical protein